MWVFVSQLLVKIKILYNLIDYKNIKQNQINYVIYTY